MTEDGTPSSTVRGKDPQPLNAVFSAYDVTTVRPERDITQFFRDAAVSLGAELDALRTRQSESDVALATADERVRSLRHQVATLRRVQLLAGLLGVLGAVLVGFGVNFLSSDKPTPGWVMLILGGLIQLVAVAAPYIDRDDEARS